MDINKLEYSRWILERNLHWISVIEAKTGVIVSIDTAMLGALAVAFGGLAPSERSAWAIVVLRKYSIVQELMPSRGLRRPVA